MKDKICVVVYDDAVYFTHNFDPKRPPMRIISVGEIRRINNDFIDLIFLKSKKNFHRGIIIPLSAVTSCEELKYIP